MSDWIIESSIKQKQIQNHLHKQNSELSKMNRTIMVLRQDERAQKETIKKLVLEAEKREMRQNAAQYRHYNKKASYYELLKRKGKVLLG